MMWRLVWWGGWQHRTAPAAGGSIAAQHPPDGGDYRRLQGHLGCPSTDEEEEEEEEDLLVLGNFYGSGGGRSRCDPTHDGCVVGGGME